MKKDEKEKEAERQKQLEEEAKKQLTPRSGIDDLTTQVVSGRNKNESLIKSM